MIIEKTYICPIVGTGATREDARRPRLADLSIVTSWFMVELGKFNGVEWCLVSIVADDLDHQKIMLDKDETHFATRTIWEVDSSILDSLKTKLPNLLEKWEIVKKSWVTLDEKTGKEESKSE